MSTHIFTPLDYPEDNDDETVDEIEAWLDANWLPLDLRSAREHECIETIWRIPALKDFVSLNILSLVFGFLWYFTGMPSKNADRQREWPMVANYLPERLEYLCIRDYQAGESEERNDQVDALMEQFESGLSTLEEIEGVEQVVHHARDPVHPDELLCGGHRRILMTAMLSEWNSLPFNMHPERQWAAWTVRTKCTILS